MPKLPGVCALNEIAKPREKRVYHNKGATVPLRDRQNRPAVRQPDDAWGCLAHGASLLWLGGQTLIAGDFPSLFALAIRGARGRR
jgi:hypothetical protein